MAGMLTRALVAALLLLLAGCGDNRQEQVAAQINKYSQLSESRIASLGEQLQQGSIRNAMLLEHYAGLLESQKPALAPLVKQLALDAGTDGALYGSLKRRLEEAKNPANFIDEETRLQELENLYQAADPALYNDLLSDPVNVLADMSDGQLARVNAISRESESLANGADDLGPGSQLVGNPAYGQWQTNSNGTSFWAWYGMYSMFSNLFNRPVYYDNWSRGRNYSYYHDVGRYRYSSPRDVLQQDKVFQQEKKRFDSQGKRFDSPYAKTRSGASGLSRQSSQAPSSRPSAEKPKFRSNYGKDSSFRDSRSRTTRSVRRGK
ncbi:hypothetical protein JYB88_03660 [Shewanella cyperi]|uniref:Lipoprotein n=1 Tax=Shewanella cyperi TaxID=2814292 RepID=A0A974XLV1_9GAMM|nr:hypothetical protein [Shewanella cyperi]QSX30769.1 hypothetical protein JYB88_03660 [Shewanella cyperi]